MWLYKKLRITILFFIFLLLGAVPAFAAAPDGMGPWADSVVVVHQGLLKNHQPVPAVSSDYKAPLGALEDDTLKSQSLALGFGGSVVLKFDNAISNGVFIVESNYPDYSNETAKIEISEDNIAWRDAGTIPKGGIVNVPTQLRCARYIRITDTSNPAQFPDVGDGYDVNAVKAVGDLCYQQGSPSPASSQPGFPNTGSVGRIEATGSSSIVNNLIPLLPNTGFASSALAADSSSLLYVPLIGLTSVPEPLALPQGAGNVTYHYAVKNFLKEAALTNVSVVDDKCSPVKFISGDDNKDSKLDYSETWRYTCAIKLSETTQSVATAIGTANNLPAAHKAYATVVVGSDNAPPLVSIINITKVAYPLTLPSEGGEITFTYRVNNPGVVPLSAVAVTDDKCPNMSQKLGDTNGNNFLDITEVWVYSCTTTLKETTTNTVSVEASANGLKAVGYATLTVTVANSNTNSGQPLVIIPGFPDAGANPDIRNIIWAILLVMLLLLILIFIRVRKNMSKKIQKKLGLSERDKIT